MIWRPISEELFEIILGTRSANERRQYTITLYRIGWAHTPNDHYQRILKTDYPHVLFKKTV